MSRTSPSQYARPAAAPWWPLALIALAGWAAYANSFAGVFVFDDIHNVAENPFLRRLWPPWDAMFRSPSLPTRPLPYFTFAINYALGGTDPWGYHAVNLAIHLAAAAALYEIVRRTLSIANARWNAALPEVGLALATSLLWVVHPIQTQAVTYIYQRIESLMGLFLFLTLLTFIVAMQTPLPYRRQWLILSVLACAAGMASKEVMIVAPLLIIWYDRVFIAESWGNIVRNRWPYYAALAATWAMLAFVVWSQRGQYAELAEPPHTRSQYFCSQPGVVLWYLRLLVWPQGQCLDYGWQPYRTWSAALPALIVMSGILAGTGWLVVKRPALGFAAGSFFLVLSVTSSVLVVADLAMEHRMYVPSAAAIALAVLGAYCVLQWIGRCILAPAPRLAAIQVTLLMAAATALGVATHVRNQAYFSYRAMCEDIVRKCDFHVRAYLNLLEVFRTDGQPDRGIALCQAQVHRDPDSVVAQCLLGEAYRLAKRYEEAEAAYRLAQAKNPRFEDAHYGLGQVAAERGDHQLAITHFRRAVELFPQFQKAHHSLGKSLAILGRDTEAAESFHKAIAVGRYNTEAMQDLAVILDGQGRSVEAAALLREYLEVHPEHLFAWDSLGIACLGARDFRGAAEAFARVLAVDPHQAEVRVSLVRALAAAGEPEAALATLNTGIQLARQAGPPQAVARFDDLRRQLTGRPGPDAGGP